MEQGGTERNQLLFFHHRFPKHEHCVCGGGGKGGWDGKRVMGGRPNNKLPPLEPITGYASSLSHACSIHLEKGAGLHYVETLLRNQLQR